MPTTTDAPQTAYMGVIRCECGGEMYSVNDSGDRSGGETVECGHCGSIGGVNVESMDTFGAVDELEVIGN